VARAENDGVGNFAKPGWRSKVSIERANDRMSVANVRRTGTGHPEPAQQVSTLREGGDDEIADCLRAVAHLAGGLALASRRQCHPGH
jgi:hypothetical protein